MESNMDEVPWSNNLTPGEDDFVEFNTEQESREMMTLDQRRAAVVRQCKCRYCRQYASREQELFSHESDRSGRCEQCRFPSSHLLQKCPKCKQLVCIDNCTAGGGLVCLPCFKKAKESRE